MEEKWWQSSVVYQIYPKSFFDSNNDGIGDLQGIISKLDYIKKLGADVIWLNPIYQSPNIDNGYDISDYQAINPEYGTMNDIKELIQKCRQMGKKIGGKPFAFRRNHLINNLLDFDTPAFRIARGFTSFCFADNISKRSTVFRRCLKSDLLGYFFSV